MGNNGYKGDRVGWGNPPKQHQWPKGRSGNPRGRPPKRPVSTLLDLIDPHSAMIVAHDNLMIERRTNDGRIETITRREAILQRLFVKGLEGDRAALIKYLEISSIAQAKATEFKLEMQQIASDHRSRYMDMFLDAEREGKPLPRVYPDPRDVVIQRDGSVEIVGPINRSDYLEMQDILKHRDDLLAVLEPMTLPEHQQLPKLRAVLQDAHDRIDECNKLLPPRLRRDWRPQEY